MKIFHVAETIKGGVATVLRHLVEGQTVDGSCVVHCLVPHDHIGELGPAGSLVAHTFHRTGRNLRSLASLALAFSQALLRERPDVVHVHSTFAGVICRVLLFMARPICRPSVVYCPHGWSFIMDVRGLKRSIYVLIERMLIRVTDAAICVSHFEKATAMEVGLGERKLHVVHNGVRRPGDLAEPARRAHAGVTRLLYVGRLDHAKGFDILVEAMRKLPLDAYHLTVVGDSVEKHAERPIMGNITYAGWLAPSEVYDAMAHADVLVVPSRWESFCLVAAEAQVMGLAVIAGERCSLPEIVSSGETGVLFRPHSAEAIVQAVKGVSAMELAEMGHNAKQASEGRFTIEEMNRRIFQIYASVQ